MDMDFRILQRILFFGVLLGITVFLVWLIHDFLMPIFWAVVFGIIFHPVQAWYLKKTGDKKNIATALSLITILIVVVVPLYVVGDMLVDESIELYGLATQTELNLIERAQKPLAYFERFGIDQADLQERLRTWIQGAGAWITDQAITFGQSTFGLVLDFFVMVYLLFFVLRDGETIRTKVIHMLPLGDKRESLLFERFTSTTRAIIKGTVVIAIIQGVLGGVLFAIAGVSGVVLWAVIMTILSIIPAIGPAVVWLPAGLILLFTGAVWQGVLVLIGGGVVISLIDNILRPILVGKDTEMPDFLVLLSIVGGLSVMGMEGFIVGPIIMAFFLAIWHLFEEEYREDLVTRG